jgi:hypothetical protein
LSRPTLSFPNLAPWYQEAIPISTKACPVGWELHLALIEYEVLKSVIQVWEMPYINRSFRVKGNLEWILRNEKFEGSYRQCFKNPRAKMPI